MTPPRGAIDGRVFYMLTRKVQPTGKRPPTASPTPDSLDDPGSDEAAPVKLFHRLAQRMEVPHHGGVGQPRPEGDAAEDEADSPPDEVVARRAEIESWVHDELGRAEETLRDDAGAIRERLTSELRALVERSVGEQVAEAEEAVGARLEHRAVQLQAWAEQVRVETEERIRGAQQSLSFRARRHELKLARQERNRKIKTAERRLGSHGEMLAAELRRQAIEAEERIRAAEQEVERQLGDAGSSIAEALRRDLLRAAAGPDDAEMGVVEGRIGTPGRGRRFVAPS